MYVQQKFSATMNGVNGAVARSWRVEFKKNAITPNEIVFMRDNLILLNSPEFIPNSITLIALCRNQKEELRPALGHNINPDSLPSKEEILNKRTKTASIRSECMELINEMVNRKQPEKHEKSISRTSQIAPGPSDRMVRLVFNHNKLLIMQGLSPLNFPQCKSRAFELGLM